MIIKFNEEYYKLAKTVNWSEIQDYIKWNDEEQTLELEECDVTLENSRGGRFFQSSVNVLLGCIIAEIDMTGLSDDQNEVLPRGRDLYNLYDSIYYNLPRE